MANIIQEFIDALNTINDMKLTFNNAIHDQEHNITEAINNNTLVIQKLLDKMDKE